MFRKDLAKAVLLHFWNLIERELNLVSLTRERPENLFHQLTQSGMKPSKALQIVGSMAIVESVGLRGLKSIVPDYCLRKLFKDKEFRLPESRRYISHYTEIKRQLSELKPIVTGDIVQK